MNAFDSWRLTTAKGRQTWSYTGPSDPESLKALADDFTWDKTPNSNSSDRVFRRQQLASLPPLDLVPFPPSFGTQEGEKRSLFEAIYRGIYYFQALQSEEGHWPGDYGGPLFLLPGLLIAAHITDTPLGPAEQVMMGRYMLNHQNTDGGWGLHISDESTLLTSVLQYVALRLLRVDRDQPEMLAARKWILEQGDATAIPLWGKIYLSLLGVYAWEGCPSLSPELWILPQCLPIHPSRYWAHFRMVYLPMAYCYGHRITGRKTELTEALRQEIYRVPYEHIDWERARGKCAATDAYYASTWVYLFQVLLNGYEKIHFKALRKKALDFCLSYINAEDEYTQFIDLGTVNQIMNSICVWHAYGRESLPFTRHVARWKDYLWVAEDGMKMSGYNGSQLWDTFLSALALFEGGFERYFQDTVLKAHQFVVGTRIEKEMEGYEKFFWNPSRGGWPFSTREQHWIVAECAGGALTFILRAYRSPLFHDAAARDIEGVKESVDRLLSLQNQDGGWTSYEPTRAPRWLEKLNPLQIFGKVMLEYSYTECSSWCLQALILFKECFPDYRSQEISNAICRGVKFILLQQRVDGSWYGSWGICFTYATWLAIEALKTAQTLPHDPQISKPIDLVPHPISFDGLELRESSSGCKIVTGSVLIQYGPSYDLATPGLCRAPTHQNLLGEVLGCTFLISKQRDDGGWGESFESCLKERYVEHRNSQVVNTAWAVLGLMKGDCKDKMAIKKAIALILSRQKSDGDWEQEDISGMFNKSCAMTYASYRNIFPIWALSRYFQDFCQESAQKCSSKNNLNGVESRHLKKISSTV